MATYSAFFSSGLLAAHHFSWSRAHTPSPPSSPILTPSDPFEIDCGTPTPSHTLDVDTQTTPNAALLNIPTAAEQPRLRKRRSSITLGVSTMNAIKSPIRNAGVAHHRGLIGAMSPSRTRSGSLNSGVAIQGAGNTGRKRNGTISGRPRRTLFRRAPVAPPPTAPLPDIPAVEAMSPILGHHLPVQTATPVLCFSATQKSMPRQPLVSRSTIDITDNNATRLPGTTEKSCFDAVYIIDEEMKEN